METIDRKEMARVAREGARVAAARRRFAKWAKEMEEWGYPPIEHPKRLNAPKLP